MNANNFFAEESVLLIGEGNFSFSVSFQKIVPLVKITATCFESTVNQQTDYRKFQNIETLKQKGVRVLLGVDGTKLPSHSTLGKELFSKIIFNFPHIGGKMKISLNRKLLKEFFKNISPVLMLGGSVLVSLCQGQGGTAADTTFRCWGNSWQVVEMAAHGGFVLCNIDRFPSELFLEYTSVGYRSRDQPFHTNNALVHVFRKAKPIPSTSNVEFLLQLMDLKCLKTIHGAVMCDSIYVEKYKNNPIIRDGSPIHYLYQAFKQIPLAELSNSAFVRHLSDNEIPLYIKNPNGKYTCNREGEIFSCNLRASLLDVVEHILLFVDPKIIESTIIFAGTVFNVLKHDFSSSPLRNHLLIIGRFNIENACLQYIKHLLSRTVGNMNRTCLGISASPDNSLSSRTMLLRNLSVDTCDPTKTENIIGQTYLIKTADAAVEFTACVIFLDQLALQIFHSEDWREIWASNMLNDRLLPASLHSQTFHLDVCFSNLNSSPYDETAFEQALWAIGGDFIIKLSASFNEFVSDEGWQSRCYSISYRSFESALYKNRARDIHMDIMRAICSSLGYKLH